MYKTSLTITDVFRFALAVMLLACCSSMIFAQAQKPDTTNVRRPLPKRPAETRSFEQYAGRDAANRGHTAGATREGIDTPLVPAAPRLGLAYNARPFFAWSVAMGAPSYRLMIYDGDVQENPQAPTVFETDVKNSEFEYPTSAPALAPGKIYSWRVAATVEGKTESGSPVSFFVLAKLDADEVLNALTQAKLLTPTTKLDYMKQASLFTDYGVWYDALRAANHLSIAHPEDKEAQEFYDDLFVKLNPPQTKSTQP